MNSKPFFSVVIPLYNKEKYIEATLKSVFNQTFRDFEIIIVNDGSTDNSLSLVSKLVDPKLQIISTENKGVSFARNLGINKANADYIALLDADDQWYPNHLQTMFDLIKEFPEAGMYCSRYAFSFAKNSLKKAMFKGIPEDFKGYVPNYFESSFFDSIAHTSAVTIPKHIFFKVNFFDITMWSGQDTYLWIQIALKYNVVLGNVTTSVFNKYANSLSKSDYTKDRIVLIDKFKKEEINNKPLQRYMDKNRYAIALSCKLNNKKTLGRSIYNDIDKRHMNLKQKIIFKLPCFILIMLFKSKKALDNFGLRFHLYR